MEKTFGWCFIGTGTLAKIVAEQILPSGRHRIVSVYSRNAENRKAFAEKTGAGLTVMKNGEHWFHTAEQMAFLDRWAAEKL